MVCEHCGFELDLETDDAEEAEEQLAPCDECGSPDVYVEWPF